MPVSLLVQCLAVLIITYVLFLLLPERCNAETANVLAADTSCQGNFRTHSTEQVLTTKLTSNARVPVPCWDVWWLPSVSLFWIGQKHDTHNTFPCLACLPYTELKYNTSSASMVDVQHKVLHDPLLSRT